MQAEAAVGCEGRLVPVRVTTCPPHGLILRQWPDILASPVARLDQQETAVWAADAGGGATAARLGGWAELHVESGAQGWVRMRHQGKATFEEIAHRAVTAAAGRTGVVLAST